MDPDICHNFLKYQPQLNKLREKFLQPKTIAQIKSTPPKRMEQQFYVLSSAEISEKIFNLEHPQKNRYKDIHTYEHSRVKIDHINNYYINANEIKSLMDGKIFAIFSQAPVENFDNFWEAAYYKNTTVVIMLCSFYDPKRGHQSQQYWPDHGEHKIYSSGKLKVKNIQHAEEDSEFIVNRFEIQGPEGVKNLIHFHWMGWSDLKKPVQSNMKRFQEILQVCFSEIQKKNLIWIHCSAGIGRTGTLGGVIEAIRLYRKNKSLSIFGIVENMRKYRFHAVQTFEQYKFLYQYLSKKLS